MAKDVDALVSELLRAALDSVISERCTYTEARVARAAMGTPAVARVIDRSEEFFHGVDSVAL
jgi:hypothetical protein